MYTTQLTVKFLPLPWSFDYDCDYTNCICDESICRCTRIINLKINSCNVEYSDFDIRNQYKKPCSLSTIEKYGIARLMSIHECYKTDNYNPIINNGYYGEEVTGFNFYNATLLNSNIEEFLSIDSDLKKIFFLLEKEYGYILNDLQNCSTVTIQNFDISKLIKNDKHFYTVKFKDIKNLNDFTDKFDTNTIPNGIVFENRLIDGYHRTHKALLDNVNSLDYFVLS